MNGQEIREQIIQLNKVISEQVTPAIFTLNKTVQEAQDAIKHLREVCPHEYDELGYCIYCDKKVD